MFTSAKRQAPLPVAASPTDIDVDVQRLAPHKIAAQFSLPITIAKVVADHAGLGNREAA